MHLAGICIAPDVPSAPWCSRMQLDNTLDLDRVHQCAGLEKKLAEIASKRSMDDLTVGPVLTWSTEAMLGHVDKLLKIPGEISGMSVSMITALPRANSLPGIFNT